MISQFHTLSTKEKKTTLQRHIQQNLCNEQYKKKCKKKLKKKGYNSNIGDNSNLHATQVKTILDITQNTYIIQKKKKFNSDFHFRCKLK